MIRVALVALVFASEVFQVPTFAPFKLAVGAGEIFETETRFKRPDYRVLIAVSDVAKNEEWNVTHFHQAELFVRKRRGIIPPPPIQSQFLGSSAKNIGTVKHRDIVGPLGGIVITRLKPVRKRHVYSFDKSNGFSFVRKREFEIGHLIQFRSSGDDVIQNYDGLFTGSKIVNLKNSHYEQKTGEKRDPSSEPYYGIMVYSPEPSLWRRQLSLIGALLGVVLASHFLSIQNGRSSADGWRFLGALSFAALSVIAFTLS